MTPVSHGKPCAGNQHARFEEGASAPEEPRRNALLHKTGSQGVLTLLLGVVLAVSNGIVCFAKTVIRVTPEQGMAGLIAARDSARRAPRPAAVVLAAGTYRLDRTFALGAEDSDVRYVADGDVTISGARIVAGWRVEADGTWSASVDWVRPDREGGFRTLFVNGQARPRARLPKKGYFTVVNDDLPEKTAYNVKRPSFFYDPKEFDPQWKNLSDAEIVCYHFWTDSHLRIASVDAVSNKVTFVTPCGKAFDTGWSNNKTGGLRGIYVIENIPAAMTDPGEWWFDYASGVLHYRPVPGETPDKAVVEVPFVRTLVSIEGSPEKDLRPAKNIVFRGIRFVGSQYELAANDTNNSQGSAGVAAAVKLRGAWNCRLRHCSFEDLGGYAVDLLEGSRDCVLSHCTMTRLAAGGVRIDGGAAGCNPLALNSGTVVEDCEIGPFGLDFRSAVGVLLMNAEKARIVHNHIFDGWYTGISAGWVWGYYPSVCRQNEISHNHIHKIGQGCLSDMGGIYMLGPSYGTRVANNRIHDINARSYGGWGIYNDEGSVGILIENNVVYDTKSAGYDIHYAKDITVRNNIFAFGLKDQIARTRQEPHVSCDFVNNIVYWREGALFSGAWNDAATPFPVHRRGNVASANGTSTVTFTADRNVYFNPNLAAANVVFGDGKTLAQWRAMGKDVKSVYADPLFEDVVARDFRLKPGSPAFALGFVDFDQSDVGPRK